MSFIAKILLSVILLVSLLMVNSVLAQVSPIPQKETAPLTRVADIVSGTYDTHTNESTATKYLGLVVLVFLSLMGVTFIGLMIYAGYNWMTAGGNEEKVGKASHTIKTALIGIIILIGVYAIWKFVLERLIIQ